MIVPGSIETRTGGYGYDRRIAGMLGRRGWTIDIRELDDEFPHPSAAALERAASVLAAIGDGELVLIDGLACGAMPDAVEREAARLRIVAIVHMPLAAEVGLIPDEIERRERSERRALACARLVVVTGRSTARTIEAYGVARDQIATVEPGTDRVPTSRSRPIDAIRLISVGAIVRGKGHELLVSALSRIPERNWRLTCAGSVSRDCETVDRVCNLLLDTGLNDRVTLAGELDDAAMASCYAQADVFVLATLRETYGMAVAEAIARGLPVVSTATGEIPRIAGDAGILVPPGDLEALSSALSLVVGNADVRARLRASAVRARRRLRTWDQAIDELEIVLTRVRANE